MPIVYALISRDVNVLCDWTASGVEGNFSLVSRLLLRKLKPDGPTRCSYTYNQCVFHYTTHISLVYLCMTDRLFPSDSAFSYLAALQSHFNAQRTFDPQTAVAYSQQVAFLPTFAHFAQLYNTSGTAHATHPPHPASPPSSPPDPATVQTVMVANLARILERGERIELLVQKASTMEEPAVRLVIDRDESRSRRKQKMQRGTCRIAAVLAVFVGAVLYVSLTLACGGPKLPKCMP